MHLPLLMGYSLLTASVAALRRVAVVTSLFKEFSAPAVMHDNYYDREVQDAVIYLVRLLGSLLSRELGKVS